MPDPLPPLCPPVPRLIVSLWGQCSEAGRQYLEAGESEREAAAGVGLAIELAVGGAEAAAEAARAARLRASSETSLAWA